LQLAAGVGLAMACAAPFSVSAELSVRVLLAERSDAVRVEFPGASSRLVSAEPDGLRIDGREVGDHWSAPAPGPYRLPALSDLRVDGALHFQRTDAGLRVIASVPLELYVASTVGREMPASWAVEALRAQAVVSRTYALRAMRQPADPLFDVHATTASQVFGGTQPAASTVRAASEATRGSYLAHQGEPILAAFHSASGGRTAAAEEVWGKALPYLITQEVEEGADAPSTYWRAAVSHTTLGRALSGLGLGVGSVEQLKVVESGPSGRVNRLVVRGSRGEQSVSGRLLRELLGESVLKSTLFELRERKDEIVFVGSGHGHGVGMSQWGARAMAARGANYQEILATFYPGTQLLKLPGESPRVASSRERGEQR
jgi:stage II sporulation protein D